MDFTDDDLEAIERACRLQARHERNNVSEANRLRRIAEDIQQDRRFRVLRGSLLRQLRRLTLSLEPPLGHLRAEYQRN